MKRINFPDEILRLIGEFNPEHREKMDNVFKEMILIYSNKIHWMNHYSMIIELIPHKLLCNNCNERKLIRYINIEFCSSVCEHQFRDSPPYF